MTQEKSQEQVQEQSKAQAPRLGFWRTLQAVLWAMLGVRKSAGYREDAARLNPVYVIVIGVAAGAVFVFVLLTVVRWAVSSLS